MSLLKIKFTYKPLSRCEVNGKRLYQTPDGHRIPSVTTILDKTKPEESRIALANWRKAVGEKKAQQITVEAANRGTRMHKFLEDHIKGIPLNEEISNPFAQQSQKMAKIVISEGLKNVNEVWGSEVPLYFPQLYAGTTDCVGVHQGQDAILDFKQTNKTKKREYIDDYFLQLTLYMMAHNEIYGTDIRKGVIMMCTKDYQYQEFILEPKDFDYWKDRAWDRVYEYYQEKHFE
jgi:hypothetical protein